MTDFYRIQYLAFWQDWPPGRQRGALYVLLALCALVTFLFWLWLYGATQQAEKLGDTALERHLQVSEIIQEVRELEHGRGRTQTGAPVLIAARQVSLEIGLEDKLISVRPALQATGRDGVQLYYERLDLPDLLALLEALRRDAGLQISSLTFNRRLDNSSLADLQLVLFR